MRVLLVSSHGADPGYGGAERYVSDLAHGLMDRDHDAVVLSAFPPRLDAGVETRVLHQSDWRDDRVRRLRNHVGDVVSAPWPGLRAVLEDIRPDLVHTSNLPGIGSGIWEAARRLRIPVVHTLHDYHLLCPRTTLTRPDGSACTPSPLLCGLRTRRLARWAGGVRHLIAGSEHLLGVHQGLFPAAQERVIRLPMAPIAGGAQGPPRTPPATLGYLGALTATKGVRLLLAAASELANEGIELRVAGDGPLRAEVEDGGVRYMGRVEGTEKADFLASCDVGVVPSLWDEPSGPPYVVREWLASGRPVLATRRGGLAEAAGGGVISLDATPEELVREAALLRDEPRWRQILESVPAVDGDADVSRWLDEHQSVYDAALAGIADGTPA